MPQLPSVEEMLKAGMHFGHQRSRWHPKMEPYIFGVRNGVHIIDLEKTQTALQRAAEFLSGIAARGGSVLFLGTKSQIRRGVEEAAVRAGMPFVNGRWLGGTLTNFSEISRMIKRLGELKRQMETGELAKKYTKKEQLMFSREREDLERKIGGIASLTKRPDAVIVFDMRGEKTAVTEARRIGVPMVGVCDTNVNPELVAYPVPANDDAVKGMMLLTNFFADAILEGKAHAKQAIPSVSAKA